MSKTCHRCGHENPNWCSFCRFCGAALIPDSPMRVPDPARAAPPAERAEREIHGTLQESSVDLNAMRSLVRETVREVLREERGQLVRTLVLTLLLVGIISTGLLFGGWKLYSDFIIEAEQAEIAAQDRVLDIISDLRGLRTACVMFYAEHAKSDPAELTRSINGKIEPLLPYLVTPLTNHNAKILVQDQNWYIEYPVSESARVRTALRDRANELGLTRNIQGAAYNGGEVLYMLGRR